MAEPVVVPTADWLKLAKSIRYWLLREAPGGLSGMQAGVTMARIF